MLPASPRSLTRSPTHTPTRTLPAPRAHPADPGLPSRRHLEDGEADSDLFYADGDGSSQQLLPAPTTTSRSVFGQHLSNLGNLALGGLGLASIGSPRALSASLAQSKA